MTEVTPEVKKDNTANLEKVREAMQVAQEVQAGALAENAVDFDFETNRGKYVGQVIFKRPNTQDLMRIGGIKSEIFRSAGVRDVELVDDSVRLLAHVVAYLKVVVVSAPKWLNNIDEIEDIEILYEVYGEFQTWEHNFRKKLPGKEVPNSGTTGDTETLDS